MKKNPSSWNHWVYLRPVAEWRHSQQNEETHKAMGYTWKCHWQCHGSLRCPLPATHVTVYNYITGRARRVSSAERTVCFKHALAFAEKHGEKIEPPPILKCTACGKVYVWFRKGGRPPADYTCLDCRQARGEPVPA